MYDEEIVLCASSAYTKQFYLNPEFDGLPVQVQEELKILCVLYTEDVGGILVMKFDSDGSLQLETSSNEGDLLYDEIGGVLKIRQIQDRQAELLESLELYYSVMFLGEPEEDE